MARAPALPDFDEEPGSRRWLPIAIGGALLLGVLWFLYQQIAATHGVKVEAPPPAVVQMLPPPPPPPPPPPTPQNKPPEPQDKPAPVPQSEAPKPVAAPAPAPISINGPAQAGSDAFGLQSGNGNGATGNGTGTCLGANCGGGGGGGGMSDVFYRRYLSAVLQEKVQRDDRINRLVFSSDFAITVSPTGRITQVTLLKSSGREDRDQAIRAVLLAVTNLDAPPGAVRFPQRITVRGRRSL